MPQNSISKCLKNNINGSNSRGGPLVAISFIDAYDNQDINVMAVVEIEF